VADTYDFSLDFAYDDVTKGLADITQHGKQVLDVFLKMADQIAASTTKMGKAGKEAIDPLSAIGKAADQVFKGINTNLAAMERQVRQIDMTGLEKSADKYGERIKSAQAELAKMYLAAQSVNASDEERLKLSNKIADAQAQILAMQKAQGQITALADQAKLQEKAAQAQKQAAEQAKADAKDLAAQQKQMAADAARDAKELATIQKQIDAESEARLKSLAAEAKAQARADAEALKAHNNALKQEALEAADALKELERAEAQAAKQAKASAAAHKELGQELMGVAGGVRNASALISSTLSVGIGASAKTFMDFSDQLQTFKAVAHASGDEVAYMAEKAKALEGIPTTQAAAASVELARAGLTAKEAADDLIIMSKAAIASGEDLSNVSKIMLSTNRAFGQSNSELMKTTDIITAVANATSTSVAEVGAGMSTMASTAASTHQTILQTATAFGLLRDAGVEVGPAATGYRSAMLMMLAPTKQARDELNLLTKSQNGVKEIFQENGHVRAFADVMKDLKDRLSGLSEAARGEVLAKIFDKKGINVVLAYMKQTDEKIAATTKEIQAFDGTAERTAKTMQDSMGAEFRAMLKDIENLQIEFAEKMSPTLRDFIKVISDLMASYGHLSGTMKTFISQGVLVVAGASALMSIFAQLVISIGGVIFAYNGLAAAGAKVAIQNGLVGSSASGLNNAMLGMAGGAGGLAMFALGLGAIVSAGILVIQQIEELNKALEGLDTNLGVLDSVQQKTSGALSTALRAQREGKPLTKEQADAADVNTRNMVNGYKDQIQELTSLWKDYAKAKKDAELGDGSGSGAVDALEEKLKAFGVKDASDVNRILRSYQDRINKLQGTHTEVESLQAGNVFSSSGLDAIKKGAPVAGPDKLTDADLEGADSAAKKAADKADKAAAADVSKYVADLKRQMQSKLAGDKEQIAKQVISSVAKDTTDSFDIASKLVDKILTVGIPHATATEHARTGIWEPITKAKGRCWEAVAYGIQATFTDMNLYGMKAWEAAEQLAKSKHFKEMPVQSLEQLKKMLKRGDTLVYNPGNPNMAGHIETYKGDGKVISDYSDGNLMGRYYKGTHALPRVFRPLNADGSESGGGRDSKQALEDKKKELEYQKSIIRQQEMLNALKTKEAEIAAKFGTDSKAYAAIHGAVMDAETKLTDLRTKSTEASDKARKDRVSAEQKANEEIAKLREAHQAAQIALMEEGEDKIKAQREAELQANANDLQKALANFNGTQKQKEAIQAGYAQKDLDTNARWDKAKLDLKDKLAKESREFDDKVEQGRIDAMAEGLPKQQALIQFELEKQLDAYDDQEKELVKRKLEKSQQFKDIEILRTQAVADASKKRAMAELQDMAATAQARKDFLEAMVSDEQKAFESSLQNLIASKKKVGIGLNKVAGSLKSEEVAGLAQSLGQDSAGSLLANLKEQVRAIEDANKAEEGLQANRDKGSAEYKRQQNAINAAKKEQTELEKMIAVLSDKGLQDQVGKYQEVLKKLQAINEEHQRFQGIIEGVTSVAQGFAASFGEAGRNIASGLGVASGAISSLENLMTNFKSMPEGKNSVADFFGDIKNVKDVVGLITTGVGLVGQLVTGLVNANAQTQAAIQKATNAALDYNSDRAVAEAQRRVDDIKRQGMDSSDAEIALSNARAAAEKSKLARNNQELIQYAYNAVSPYAKDKSVAGARSIYDSGKLNVLSGDPRGAELIGLFSQSDKIDEDNAKNQADIRKASFEKRAKDLQVLESKYSEYMLTLAKTGNDKLVLADAEAEAQKLAIRHKYDAEFKDATDKHIEDQSDIMARYYAEMALADKEAAQKRRDINAENAKFEIDAMTKHEQSKIGLMQDGYQKDRALAVNARDAEQRNFTADMMRYEKHTKEYSALAQQKADALEAANERIRKSDEANALARTKDLNAMKAATAQALAAMTDSGLDDIAVQRQTALADMVVAEGEERKKAIANYGEDQEILNGISAKYAALRAKNNRDTEKQALESVRKDYETMQQQILTGQLHPLQMILDKENDRVRLLQRANEELQHSLDLIDKRYAKENKAQDLADRAQFDVLKGGGISLADLTAGANEIANEDIINGKVTDRSSKATQLRGLKLLLARQAQDAETKRKNEGYDSTNSDLNEQGFASDMARILGRQAAVVEAAKAEAKTAKEKSDLDAEGADLYVKYQQLQKDALAAKQRVEQQGIRDQMDANSALIDQGWDTVTQTKRQMEDLQTAYDVKMKGVSDAFMVAGNSSDVLLAKLKQWAPALAASAQAAVASIKTVTNALNTPIPTVGSSSGSGSSSSAYVGPSRVSVPTPGYTVTDGTYWYKSTSDMYAASATHMASGGVVPGGFEGDNFPALLKTGERVLPAAFNSRLENMLQHFSSLPLPSTNHYGGNSIGDIYISRDVDLSKLEAILDQRDFRRRGQNMGRYGGTGLSRN